MISNGLFTSNNQEWETPQKLFEELNKEFNFTLDACASKSNHKLERYYTEKDSALNHSWKDERVFINPPYNRNKEFIKKCFDERESARVIVLLIPARTDTKYFHEYIYHHAEIRFIKGRLKYELNGKSLNSSPFPSMLVIWRR